MNNKQKDEVLDEAAADTSTEASQEEQSAGFDQAEDTETKTDVESKEQGEKTRLEEEDMKTQYLRLAADFQNYKRRTEKEKSDIYAFANEKIVTELLDVIDNFERAITHQGDCADHSMTEGMKMIFKQLKGVLEKNKVEEIKAIGEDFDPNFHHAVMTENSVEYESGKVTQVLQKGYSFNGKVIRPAMVKVAE